MMQGMGQLESRFQLRRAGAAGAWRPPCAIGAAVCAEIETHVQAWQRTAIPHTDFDVATLLEPCLCLFRLIASASSLHRRQIDHARSGLSSLEARVQNAPEGAYLKAIGSQIAARVQLQLAWASLLENDFLTAIAGAELALDRLQDRGGPRDFWPPHCWEMAACHRIVALAQLGMRGWRHATEALSRLSPMLSPISMKTAEPQLSSALHEDMDALKLECDVARQINEGVGDKWAPTALHAFQRSARELLERLQHPHSRAALQALLAKLCLVQELPWYAAGSARSEVLEEAWAQLESARHGMCVAAALQKVTALQVVCAAMKGDVGAARDQAESWVDQCTAAFGSDVHLTVCARQLVQELTTQSKPNPQVLQKSLSVTLTCIGAGMRH
jgi:hypothetical protein